MVVVDILDSVHMLVDCTVVDFVRMKAAGLGMGWRTVLVVEVEVLSIAIAGLDIRLALATDIHQAVAAEDSQAVAQVETAKSRMEHQRRLLQVSKLEAFDFPLW